MRYDLRLTTAKNAPEVQEPRGRSAVTNSAGGWVATEPLEWNGQSPAPPLAPRLTEPFAPSFEAEAEPEAEPLALA